MQPSLASARPGSARSLYKPSRPLFVDVVVVVFVVILIVVIDFDVVVVVVIIIPVIIVVFVDVLEEGG